MLEFIKRLLGIATKVVETVEKTAPYKVEAPTPAPAPVVTPAEAPAPTQVAKKAATGAGEPGWAGVGNREVGRGSLSGVPGVPEGLKRLGRSGGCCRSRRSAVAFVAAVFGDDPGEEAEEDGRQARQTFLWAAGDGKASYREGHGEERGGHPRPAGHSELRTFLQTDADQADHGGGRAESQGEADVSEELVEGG